MWRWLILVVLIVGASAVISIVVGNLPAGTTNSSLAYPAPEIPKGPIGRLLVDGPAEYDFGKWALQAEGSHEFVIKNEGEGNLTLRPGSSDCQCTVAEFHPRYKGMSEIVLKPGESTPITVTWTPKNAGAFRHTPTLESSDPAHPRVGFVITGDVYPPLITYPPEPAFQLPAIQNDQAKELMLAISSFDKPNMNILEVVSSNPEMVAATSEPLPDDAKQKLKFETGYRINITLNPTSELGDFHERLTIKTNHPKMPELVVPVNGRWIGPISVSPDRLQFDANGKTGTRNVSLLIVRDQEETTFRVAHKPRKLQVEVEPLEQGTGKVRRYRLITSVPPESESENIEGTIILETDHPKAKVIKIPVKVIVLGG